MSGEIFPVIEKITNYQNAAEAQVAGVEFANRYLIEPLQKLRIELQQMQAEKSLDDDEIGFVFLDRDARPALHVWQALTQSRYSAIPLPVSRAQLSGMSAAVEQAMHEGFFRKETYQSDFDQHFREYADINTTARHWMNALSATLKNRYDQKKLVVIIDTGYLGSAAELTRFLCQQAVPGATVLAKLMYGSSSAFTPSLMTKTEGMQKDFEHTAPSATIGYQLASDPESDTKLFEYKRDDRQVAIEAAFMRGVKLAADAAVARSDQ